jgi:hypothetical protein
MNIEKTVDNNRMLYSDFADQGREIECIFLKNFEE